MHIYSYSRKQGTVLYNIPSATTMNVSYDKCSKHEGECGHIIKSDTSWITYHGFNSVENSMHSLWLHCYYYVMSLFPSCVPRRVWCLAGVLCVECGQCDQWTISCSLFWSKLRPCFIQTSSKLLHSSLPVVDQLCVAKMLEHLNGCHEEYEVCQWHTCTGVPLAAKDPNLYLSYHISLFRGILD